MRLTYICLLIHLVHAQNDTATEGVTTLAPPEDRDTVDHLVSYALLQLYNGTLSSKLCALYYPHLTDVDTQPDKQHAAPLLDLADQDPCSLPSVNVSGALVLLQRSSECDVVAVAADLQNNLGAVGSLLVSNSLPNFSAASHGINLLIISNESYASIGDASQYKAQAYTVVPSPLNWSLLIIWLIATSAAVLGGCWSGYTRHTMWHLAMSLPSTVHTTPEQAGEDGGSSPDHEDTDTGDRTPKAAREGEPPAIHISVVGVVCLVAVMCCTLLSLYYLYDYLVYVILALFVLASISALFDCLRFVMRRLPLFHLGSTPAVVVGYRIRVVPAELALFAVSVAFSLSWFFLRKESYAWALQDILGFCFTVHMIKNLRLSNLKVITLLLILLFAYDVFFVFVTPLMTRGGDSIMVAVAKGGAGGEELPMVFKVPHLGYDEIQHVCRLSTQYNLLGFGDVMVPGILLGFLHYCDRTLGGTPVYTLVGGVAYGAGILVTFVALVLMQSAQPALLYLVPCCLGAALVVGAVRQHLGDMWAGREIGTNERQRLQ